MGSGLCNFCSLGRITAKAEAADLKILIVNSGWGSTKLGWHGSVNVYAVPKGFQGTIVEESPDHDRYLKAWYGSLPDTCVC